MLKAPARQMFGAVSPDQFSFEKPCPVHAFYWNVTFTVRLVFIVRSQVFAAGLLSQPDQVTVVAGGLGEAVNMTEVPEAKMNPQLIEQAIPAGELTTVPLPVIFTRRLGPTGPVPVKHTTVAVMKAV